MSTMRFEDQVAALKTLGYNDKQIKYIQDSWMWDPRDIHGPADCARLAVEIIGKPSVNTAPTRRKPKPADVDRVMKYVFGSASTRKKAFGEERMNGSKLLDDFLGEDYSGKYKGGHHLDAAKQSETHAGKAEASADHGAYLKHKAEHHQHMADYHNHLAGANAHKVVAKKYHETRAAFHSALAKHHTAGAHEAGPPPSKTAQSNKPVKK